MGEKRSVKKYEIKERNSQALNKNVDLEKLIHYLGIVNNQIKQIEKMKAVIYARVSSKEQEKEGYSIPAQLKKIREYAKLKGYKVVQEFVDVESAKKAGRTNFNLMLKYIKANSDIEAIVCHKVDRLCRNFKDYVTIDELKIKPLFVDEEFPDNAAGKLTFGMKVLLAKHYIDNLSDEVKKGMGEKAEQGIYPSMAPLGYLNDRETKRIEIDIDRAPFIKRMFEWYSTGKYSLLSLKKKITEEGLTYRTGNKIAKSTVDVILKNPLYYGEFLWNNKQYKGSHQPIISKELFEAVQDVFKGRTKPKGKKRLCVYRFGCLRSLWLCCDGRVKKGEIRLLPLYRF